MTQPFPRILVLTGALLAGAATQAAAQDGVLHAPRTLVPAAFPRWDVGASLGLLCGDHEGSGRLLAGLGAESRIPCRRRALLDHASQDRGGRQRVERLARLRRGTVSRGSGPAAAGVHLYRLRAPVVYRGARCHLAVFREQLHAPVRERRREGRAAAGAQRPRDRHVPDREPGLQTVPGRDERSTRVLARPFIGGGFKSYITRAVFVRTEARLAFLQDGVRQVSLLVGVGTDF